MESTRMDRRKKYSLKMISQAFLELLKEKDLASITVTEVCSRADINRGTFYKYYCDIDDLFQKTCDAFLNEIYNLIITTHAVKDSAGRNFYELLNDALRIVSQNTDLLVILKKTDNFNVVVSRITSFIHPAASVQLKKLSPKLPEHEVEYMVEFIVGGCGAIVQKWLGDGMTTPKEQITNMMYKNITGILSAYR